VAHGRHGPGPSRNHHPHQRVLWASPNGGSGTCSSRHPCSLAKAVAQAKSGNTVIALRGVYHGGVVIDKRITLRGRGAVINAKGASNGNGIQIVGPGGSGSTVEGFKIKNARFEGILVGTAPVAPTTKDGTPVTTGEPVSRVTIAHNVLVDNGTGFGSDFGQCFSTPEAPGDCGETIHLVSVTRSVVADNYVADNVGGILLTDEFGPTSRDVVRGNSTLNNNHDCGITLAGHNPNAFDPTTMKPTGTAGVFDNLVEDNVSNNNGVAGQGGGILLGGGALDAGVYSNVIRHNSARGNGLAGVVIHQHAPGDLNDNVIQGNRLGKNNLDGDLDFTPPDKNTTAILVASAATPITGTIIVRNRISNNEVGIWTLNVDPASTKIAHNIFGPGVTTPISTN
jgi:nitrous oxidase accessory protein NosD